MIVYFTVDFFVANLEELIISLAIGYEAVSSLYQE